MNETDLTGKYDLRLILMAKVDGLTTTTALILNLPRKSGDAPEFKNDFYTAEYPRTATVDQELDIKEAISFENMKNDDVQISLKGKLCK